MTAATVTTACGPFTVVMRDDAVIASGWTTEVDELMEPVPLSARPSAITARRDLGPVTDRDARLDQQPELRDGASTMLAGLIQLRDGAKKLDAGLGAQALPGSPSTRQRCRTAQGRDVEAAVRCGAAKEGSSKVADGAGQVADGAGQLDAGAKKLSGGAAQVDDGAGQVAGGLHLLGEGAPALVETT